MKQIHLKKIRNEEKKEKEGEEEGNKNELKKLIFEEVRLNKILKREITLLRKKIKAKQFQEIEINRLKFRIAKFKRMERRNEMDKYFKCFKAKCDLKEEERYKSSPNDD